MKCDICSEECDGKVNVMLPGTLKEAVVCPECLKDIKNEDYDKLRQKVYDRIARAKVGGI